MLETQDILNADATDESERTDTRMWSVLWRLMVSQANARAWQDTLVNLIGDVQPMMAHTFPAYGRRDILVTYGGFTFRPTSVWTDEDVTLTAREHVTWWSGFDVALRMTADDGADMPNNHGARGLVGSAMLYARRSGDAQVTLDEPSESYVPRVHHAALTTGQDLEAFAEVLARYADDNDWCSEYDSACEALNRVTARYGHGEPFYRNDSEREFYVEVRIPFSGYSYQSVLVTARDEDAASEMVERDLSAYVDTYSLDTDNADWDYSDAEIDEVREA